MIKAKRQKLSLKTILQISRPKFWLYLAGPYIVGYTVAAQSPSDFLSFSFIYTLLYFLIPANSILYGVNDLADTDTDKFNSKKVTHETKASSANTMHYYILIAVSFLLTFPLFAFLPFFSSLLLFVFLLLAFFYSSPPIRLKAKPYVDSCSNILYAIPGFIAAYQFRDDLITLPVLVATFSWTAAMHLFSAIPDIEADTKAGLRTTAITLGYRKSLFTCGILWALTTISAILIHGWLWILLIYPVIPFLLLKNRKLSIDSIYWMFPVINGVVGFILFIIAATSLV